MLESDSRRIGTRLVGPAGTILIKLNTLDEKKQHEQETCGNNADVDGKNPSNQLIWSIFVWYISTGAGLLWSTVVYIILMLTRLWAVKTRRAVAHVSVLIKTIEIPDGSIKAYLPEYHADAQAPRCPQQRNISRDCFIEQNYANKNINLHKI